MQSPGVEYAKQEIQRRVNDHPSGVGHINYVIEYFAEKFEQQQTYNRQLEEALKAATEAVESLSHRVYMLETYPVR